MSFDCYPDLCTVLEQTGLGFDQGSPDTDQLHTIILCSVLLCTVLLNCLAGLVLCDLRKVLAVPGVGAMVLDRTLNCPPAGKAIPAGKMVPLL